MQVPFDFSEVEPKTVHHFLPLGEFECQVKSVEMGRSKEKKTPFIKLTWRCIEPGAYKDKIAVEYKYITSGTAPYFKGWSEEVMNVYLNTTLLDEQLFCRRYALDEISGKESVNKKNNTRRKKVKSKMSKKHLRKNPKSFSGTNQKKHHNSLT